MGLDTSHGCWNGPYSMFMRWRIRLAWLTTPEGADSRSIHGIGFDLEKTREFSGHGKTVRETIGATHPLAVLFEHSDCDGDIAAKDCTPLADALQALVDERMPQRAIYDEMRPATERFIAGLRLAAAANEAVRFH